MGDDTPTSSSPSVSAPDTFASCLSPLQWTLYAGIVLAAILLRWFELDMRPLHHDESLHAMYGKYFYDFPTTNYYKYDPMLHGPLLYHVLFLIYCSFGASDFTARIPAAFLGSCFVLMPLLFRRSLSATAVLIMTAAIAFSPSLVYWARFIREDVFVLTGICFCLYGVAAAPPKGRALFFFIGAAIQMCSKENSFVHIAMMLGFYIYELLLVSLRNRTHESFLESTVRWIRKYPFQLLLGAVVGVFIYILFYTDGFQYWEGPIDGLWRKSIIYWMEHHKKERIVGPFLFHVYCLSWYDSLFVIVAIFQAVHLYWRSPMVMRLIALSTGVIGVALPLFFFKTIPFEDVKMSLFITTFKLKDALDVSGFIMMVPHAILVTTFHLLRGERRLAIWGYLFATSLFTYSYLGEKVPWLSQYPLWTGIVYFVLYFDACCDLKSYFTRLFSLDMPLIWLGSLLMAIAIVFYFQDDQFAAKWTAIGGLTLTALGGAELYLGIFGPVYLGRWIAVASVLYMVRIALIINFVQAGSDKEYISQVHTTVELRDAVAQVRHQIETEPNGYRPRVYLSGDATWPVAWYFRDLPENKFGAPENERRDFKFQLIDVPEGEKTSTTVYHRRKLNLRGWWVPDFAKMTLKNFLWYGITHQPWSPTGFAPTMLLTRIGEEPGK